jgi:hypothetical protein
LPANVTVDPVLSLVKRIVELAGAEILSRRMLVHDATAEVIWAYSVHVQVVPVPAAAVVVALTVVDVVTFAVEELVTLTEDAEVVEVAAFCS